MIAAPINGKKLSPELFLRLRDFIYDKSGIFFPENKLYLLEGRLLNRLNDLGMQSFNEYVNHVMGYSNQAEELTRIYNLVTINETYFFRFPRQLEVFSKNLLPDLLKSKSQTANSRIKIWSAAASSGEELFSLAMLIKDGLGSRLENWDINLKGTDISKSILEHAKKAEYGNNSFRGYENKQYKEKYFESIGGRLKVKDDIRDMVEFDYLNLNDVSAIRQNRNLDFIFCRNVLIYFDKEMKQRVIDAFYDQLNRGGYLLLGETESLHGINSKFKVEHFAGTFVYQKA